MSKKVYNYNPNTKEYMGESDAKKDPLASEKHKKDVYLLPSNATFEQPTLAYKKGQAIVWDGAKWSYVEDHRGQEVWRKSGGEKVTVSWLGAIGSDYTTTQPAKVETPMSIDEIQKEMTRLQTELGALLKQAERHRDANGGHVTGHPTVDALGSSQTSGSAGSDASGATVLSGAN